METTVPDGYIKMPDIINISITTQGQIVNVTVDTDVERTAQDTTGTILDATAPNITGLSDDTNTTGSKTWTWGADEPATFRYLIDDKPDSIPIGVYADTTTTTISGLDGTYYIHVQAKDTAGNESGVVTVSAILAIQDTTTQDTTGTTSNTTTTITITYPTVPNTTGQSNDTAATTTTTTETTTPDTTGIINDTTIITTGTNTPDTTEQTNDTTTTTTTTETTTPDTTGLTNDTKYVSANSVTYLTINNNEPTTTSKTVTLSIEVPDKGIGLKSMQFANGSKGPWSVLETYSSTKSGWILSSGLGTKTVYVKIFDSAGNYTIKSDTIKLISDTTKISPSQESESIAPASKIITGNRFVLWLLEIFIKLNNILPWHNK